MAKKIDKNILIVEDDADFLSILKIKFTSEGFSVFTADNGEDGIAMAEKEKFDLILSDILLPKIDGPTMIKEITEFNKDVAIIFLSNIKDLEYTKETEKSEKFTYLVKADLRIGEIVEKVKEKLGL
jgi:DNA-binding response OmpR family regulator